MNGGRKHIAAQPVVAQNTKKITNRELWATLCYYYPQYKLEEASRLAVRDLKLLIRIAEKIKARDKYDYVQIVAAPHSKKGEGVKELTEQFKRQTQ